MISLLRRTKKVLVILVLLFLVSLNADSSEPILFTGDSGFLVQHTGDVQEEIYSKTLVLEKGNYQVQLAYTSSEEGNALRSGIMMYRSTVQKYRSEKENCAMICG